MVRFYLYFNAVLYIVFAIWCTLAPQETAQQLGYLGFSASGHSEYLVVYGGIELGMGLFFIYCAHAAQRVGLVFALALYAPIVVFRSISVAHFWPVAQTTLIVGSLEALLLLCGVLLWRKLPQGSSL